MTGLKTSLVVKNILCAKTMLMETSLLENHAIDIGLARVDIQGYKDALPCWFSTRTGEGALLPQQKTAMCQQPRHPLQEKRTTLTTLEAAAPQDLEAGHNHLIPEEEEDNEDLKAREDHSLLWRLESHCPSTSPLVLCH